MDLKDKVILVTGGTAGIGKAFTFAYVRAGALVDVLGLEQEYLKDTIDQIGADHLGICGDVSREEDVVSAIDKVIAKFGKLDVIHNNAGIATPAKPLHSTTDQEGDKLINVNLRGIFLTTRHRYKHLKASKGCILNTSRFVGNIGQENHAAYAATKDAVNTLTKSMATDYAKNGLRVNSILPAAVMTPILKVWASEQPEPEQVFEFLEDIHLLGYCPEGDVIADACVFLLSDKARYITGLNLPVSGGAELGYRRNV